MTIRERLREIHEAIGAHGGGRNVTLVAVTKYASVEQMREAYAAGVRDFGENKIQDALGKIAAFPPESFPDLRWHFIGSLQSNKIRKTPGQFALMHAIDSVRHAEMLSALNQEGGLRQRILIQINASQDSTRSGLSPDEIGPMIEAIRELPGIDPRGLMTMAPAEASLSQDHAALKRVFCGLRDMRDRLREDMGIALPDLSMGMSHDYVQALECGATIIRIGNYLFQNE